MSDGDLDALRSQRMAQFVSNIYREDNVFFIHGAGCASCQMPKITIKYIKNKSDVYIYIYMQRCDAVNTQKSLATY